jgi:DNA modification methylase
MTRSSLGTEDVDRIFCAPAAPLDLPDGYVDLIVTSTPYWQQRNYGFAGQLGLEPTPAEFVRALIPFADETRRVLRPDGVMFLNIGDTIHGDSAVRASASGAFERVWDPANNLRRSAARIGSLKCGDLAGIPFLVEAMLRDCGWYIRNRVVWAKPLSPAGRITNRCVSAHEYVLLATKMRRGYRVDRHIATYGDVWSFAPSRGVAGHPAVMPIDLARRCIELGSKTGDLVLDPFVGSGTTALAASQLGRHFVGCDLNPRYVEIAKRRLGISHDVSDEGVA